MNRYYMTAGAFLLVLGGSLITFAPVVVSMGYYQAEAEQVTQITNGSANAPAVFFATQARLANLGEVVSLFGVVLAPVGGAMLAYGFSTRDDQPIESPTPAPANDAD